MSFKIDELKFICKKYQLKVSGSKPTLIERLEQFFILSKAAVKIQALFRRWLVIYSVTHRGPAFKNRSICNNDTDFVTMEPLDEIDKGLFYSYADSQQFVYGFNLCSLIQTLRLKGRLMNPYNRDDISEDEIRKIIRLYNFSLIVYPNLREDYDLFSFSRSRVAFIARNNSPHEVITRNVNDRHIRFDEDGVEVVGGADGEGSEVVNRFLNYVPELNSPETISDEQRQRLRQLEQIRRLPLTQRINNLFIEIYILGNYTQAAWFHSLSRGDLNVLYRSIYDIWYFRGNLSRDVRNKICPFRSPFFQGSVRNLTTNMTYEELKIICLIVFENLVYSGEDDDHRRIGTFHALSALTLVSASARSSLPWLYEAVSL